MPESLPRRFAPFVDEEGEPRLRECYVLELDLLGTQSATAEDAARNLRITKRALERANQWAGGLDPSTVASWFSDNVAVADLVDPPDDPQQLTFGFHLITAGWMQLELSMEGLFSRGGLARGPFFASETFVYGPALVEAYRIESREAVYPRILLSPGLAEHARQELAAFGGGDTEVHRTLLAVDDDGRVFVNYLASVFDEPEDVDEMLAIHRRHVLANLEAHRGNERVYKKYEWAAAYHDRFCRSRLHPDWAAEHFSGPPEGPGLEPFGEDVPKPEPPSDFPGLSF
jgi:hypothetical protein